MTQRKTDPRDITKRLRSDWEREKAAMQPMLNQIQAILSQADLSKKSEEIEKLILHEKSIRKLLDEKERSLRTLERNSCLLSRHDKINYTHFAVDQALTWWESSAYGFIPSTDLDKWDASDIVSRIQGVPPTKNPDSALPDKPLHLDALYLESILTDWQISAARIIERELLTPRRIGSLCFLSKENGFLGIKLALMVRLGLIDPDKERVQFFKKITTAWSCAPIDLGNLLDPNKDHSQLKPWNFTQTDLRIQIALGDQPSQIIHKYAHAFDALFLDYAMLNILEQEHPLSYLEVIGDLEPAYPFIILLLKESQVAVHKEALQNMHVEVYPLEPTGTKLIEEDISTLLIARRRSRYILHYARDPWDILIRDFNWNPSRSLEFPVPACSKKLPDPYHLSEKILLASNLALRVIATNVNSINCIWLIQREVACWKKFGGQISQLPRLLSENRTNSEYKIVLQLGEGVWSFVRSLPSPTDMLAQTQSLLQILVWFRKHSLFLNNIRLDTVVINGPEIRLLSLDRLGAQETEDTISSLLWFWYDLGNCTNNPLRPWPIPYFPEDKLSEIPEPLQKIARIAASNSTLDGFLENLPSLPF